MLAQLVITLVDGSDWMSINAGSGRTIIADLGGGNDTFLGGPSTSVVNGGPGHDSLSGGVGNDSLDGALGADLLSGGAGFDSAVYSTRSASVTVTLDSAPNDGTPGESDNVASDIEQVSGGFGPDILIGNSNANLLVGGTGNDTLIGGAGTDNFDAGDGNDTIQTRDWCRRPSRLRRRD